MFCEGVNTFMLTCKNDTFFVPKNLQKYAVNWCCTYLFYPVTELTEANISQHYYCPILKDEIRTHIKICNTCFKNKIKTSNMTNHELRKQRLPSGTDYW